MALSNEQVLERIKAPQRKAQLVKAIHHEQWLRFHAEESLSREDASRYIEDFDRWVRELLPADKHAFFMKMLSFPMYTNELCTSMQDDLNKVFESQNSSFTYEFTNEQLQADFMAFLADSNFWEEWQEDAKESMLKNINSLVVVDMPQTAETTEPYFYFMPIASVIDIDLSEDEVQMLIANQEDGSVILIDDMRYAVFAKGSDGNFTLKVESFHGLGYCPACFFWQDAIKKNKPLIKSSPITSALNNLNYLVFAETSRRCLESYAAFPITVSFADDCTYYKESNGKRYECNSGWLNMDGALEVCPVCEKNKLIGPGTHFTVQPPESKDQPNNLDAVKQIPAEVESLDYWTKRTAELWDEIYYDCVGTTGDAMIQAVNKDQVRGNFESKQNVLMRLKRNIEASHKFVVETMARLRYEGSFVKCSINYGSQFYLTSASEAQTDYKSAKDSGVPNYLLAYKRSQVDAANTKGNEVDAQRLKILQYLEPWVDYDINHVDLLGLQAVDPQGYLLKADFSGRILKFESEYGSIVEFGSKLDFKTKIERIYNALLAYGPQTIPTITQPATRMLGNGA